MEDAVLVCRQNAASEALDDLHQELLPYQPNRGEETQVWEQVNVFLNEWINEIFFIANPGRKRRTSIHPMVRKYPKEVESFCRKWHLDAWWAVPAIIQSHFLRIEIGLDTPLGLFLVGSAGPINTFTVVARLPGFSDAEFERDSAKFSKAMMEQTDTFSSGPITVRWRPNRDEMAKFESEYDSACVVVDWNGRNHYPSRYARQQLTISEYLIEECEFRLGRLLTKSERRGILRQITPQIEDGRKWFLEAGWYVQGKAALQTHAQWVATRLLDPSQSWSKITGADADLLPSAISSCHQFAERALLTLPTRQSTGANASS